MTGMSTRRSRAALPAVLLGAGTWLLASLSRGGSDAFVASSSPVVRGRVAMQGFKEDFEAWRSSLTPEERQLVTKQAQKEFNKNYRKSDEFKKDLPEEKIQSFAKILGKFFDSEAEDYKKDADTKVPDYDGLTQKARGKKFDFSLKSSIVEVDRDADRRYRWAIERIHEAEEKGELFPQSSPMMTKVFIQNNDTESHNELLKLVKLMKDGLDDPKVEERVKASYRYWVEKGIPPMGQDFALEVPSVIHEQFEGAQQQMGWELYSFAQNHTEQEVKEFEKTTLVQRRNELMCTLFDNWVKVRDEAEFDCGQLKAFFRSQQDIPGKTKADVLKEMWPVLPQILGRPVPPLDEEVLAEFAKIPAVQPGDGFRHSWGIADKLYKSEAIDWSGNKYLLGVFEDKADAQKAFDDWNAEYEKASAEMALELQQFSKQEQARSDRDTTGADRIKKVLEESRR